MKSARHVRVLMLGWEYPPRFAGGLGKACQGLSQAMAKLGAQIFFVLPTFPEKVSEPRLEVVGARECMLEAGWEVEPLSPQHWGAAVGSGQVTRIKADAIIEPYSSPSERIPENLRKVMEMVGDEGDPKKKGKPLSRLKVVTNKTTHQQRSSEIYGRNLWSEIERFCFTVGHMGETHEVDVVHAHDWMTFPAAFEFQRVTGVPVYLHVHATEYDRSGENLNRDVFNIEREGFRRANHIFAVSRYTAGVIERLYGVSRKKISVVYNAPESGLKMEIAHSESKREPKVVFLGRLTFQKGPDHFLKAAALVSQAVPQAKFIFCGTGDMMQMLRHQAHRLGIESKVVFAGFLDPPEVDKILLNSKVLVMPSVSEPFGLVALEAILCGIPVILSKQSGVKEVLRRALLVDFWDHEKLADQMIAALRLPDLSKQLVEEGLGQLKTLSWEKSAQKVLECYSRNLGRTYAQAIGGAHGH